MEGEWKKGEESKGKEKLKAKIGKGGGKENEKG